MRTPLRFASLWLLGVSLAAGAGAQEPGPSSGAGVEEDLSPRNANYTIEVSLDSESKTLSGRETIQWRNIQAEPTRELWFHLYWNAWRNNRSSWMLEDRLRGRSDRGEDVRQEDWGYIDIKTLEVAGQDVTRELQFVSPDDGNPDDRTVVRVELDEPVEPGQTLEIGVVFDAKVPRTFARTGYADDDYFIAHWYPSLGVFEGGDGWNCHQFHAATEFYSDFGVYDVTMTVPAGFVLGASGRLVEQVDHPDGSVSYRHRAEDIHNFAWTASPDYLVYERRFDVAGLPAVDMRLLLQPEHRGQMDRHFAATAAALEHYGKWYGPYPYGYITIVDPAWGSGAGGMEYPTLFTCGTRIFNPFGGGSPEGVTVHEAGHQFWYGMVGNNEFEDAWLDEGLNTFSTARTMDVAFGESRLVRRYLSMPGGGRGRRGGFLPLLFDDVRRDRAVSGNRLDGYRRSATFDVPATPTYRYFPRSASAITYNKTALWLATLERYLGWETLRRILSTFFERYQFKHPSPEDFFSVANEVSEQDLGWFFDQVYRGSETFDYAVQSVSSKPAEVEGWVSQGGELSYVGDGRDQEAEAEEGSADGGRLFRTEVIVRRYGGARFPVELLMVFEDGHQVRQAWDGEARWQLFVEEHGAKIDYAVIDPERVLLLDLDYTNNSRLRESQAKFPARKWASKWMIWVQDLLATFTFFV